MPQIEFSSDQKSLPYLKSLFYERKNVFDMEYKDMEQSVTTYTDEIFKPQLILRNMSTEDKQRVHLLADIKLQEIEDSGLSRSELAVMESKRSTPSELADPDRAHANCSHERSAPEVGPIFPVYKDQSRC